MDRDYKYVVLNGNQQQQQSGRANRRLCRCFMVLLSLVGILLGMYFIYYAKHLTQSGKSLKQQKLLLISIDGFRYNLRDKAPTPNLDLIVKHGVSVDHMLNVFPTVTLTNHQSIVTGKYAENHGVVGNKMYDRKTKEKFLMPNTQAKFWNDALPIWAENELQGHKSGVCYWPGYNVLFGGRYASYVPHANYSSPLESHQNLMPYQERIDLVTEWLRKPEVNFAALYFGNLDVLMHGIGGDPVNKADEKKLREYVTEVDSNVGKVLDSLKQSHLDDVNVIIVGDHGMSNVNTTHQVIDLQRYVNLTMRADFWGDGHIYPKPGQTKIIYEKLKAAQKKEGHFSVFLKADIPQRYRLRNHPRTGDIYMVADEGWQLWTHNKLNRKIVHPGNHGYSTDVKNMHPAFFAYGPSFQRNYKQEVVKMVDLYELMCSVLKITPKPNDGNFNNVKSMLKS